MNFASYPFRKYRRQNTPGYSAVRRVLFASISQNWLVMALWHFDRLSDRKFSGRWFGDCGLDASALQLVCSSAESRLVSLQNHGW